MAMTQTTTRRIQTPPPMPARRLGKQVRGHATVEHPPTPEVEDKPLKAKTVGLINGIKVPFRNFTTLFRRHEESRAELAPKFAKALSAFRADSGGTLVDFVRLLDSTVPLDREGYRNHRSYQAANNLLRLVSPTAGERDEVDENAGPLPVSTVFIRLLAVIMALIPGNQVERAWTIIQEETHWGEGKVQNLRAEVEEVEPLMDAKAERGHLSVE